MSRGLSGLLRGVSWKLWREVVAVVLIVRCGCSRVDAASQPGRKKLIFVARTDEDDFRVLISRTELA